METHGTSHQGDEKQSLEKDIKAEPTGFAINVGIMDTRHTNKNKSFTSFKKADVVTGTRKAIVLSSEALGHQEFIERWSSPPWLTW